MFISPLWGLMQNQLEGNPNPLVDGSCERNEDSSKNVSNAMATAMSSFFGAGPDIEHRKDSIVNNSRKKLASSIVLRLTNAEKNLLNRLSDDYAESLVAIMGKSLRLYRGIVEAVEQGGSLIMVKHSSPAKRKPSASPDDSYEAIIAVREQFASKGKTPIALNRTYISASKGLKTERLAIRINPTIAEGLADLENKTGLSRSDILRDGMHLYNFVKREHEKSDTSFYIGDTPVKGI
jgi:hypothetical protein